MLKNNNASQMSHHIKDPSPQSTAVTGLKSARPKPRPLPPVSTGLKPKLRSAARHEYENGFRCHLSVMKGLMKGPNILQFWEATLLEANKIRSLTSPNFTTSSIIWSKACGTLWKQKSLKRNEKQQWIIHCIFTLGPHVYPVISSNYLSSQTSWCSMWLLWLSI